MICVTIVQESRRLALADMLNAAQLGADLVEVRLDKFDRDANLTELVAARKKPVLFPGRRRVVSYTNLEETPRDVADVYEQLQRRLPDVIKVTCKADTPEEAWPLLQLLNRPP